MPTRAECGFEIGVQIPTRAECGFEIGVQMPTIAECGFVFLLCWHPYSTMSYTE